MYKVFIQNKPLFFISLKEMSNFDGFFIREGLALADKAQVTFLLKSIPTDIGLHILCEDPQETFQLFFDNHEKIEAAGGIVKRKERYLFIKRNGCWDIPKGKLEGNESPEAGALREIEEECGITNISIEKPITITYHTYQMKGIDTLKKTYWFAVNYTGPKIGTPQLEEGITKVSWKKVSKIDTILANTYSSIADVIKGYFY